MRLAFFHAALADVVGLYATFMPLQQPDLSGFLVLVFLGLNLVAIWAIFFLWLKKRE